MRLGPIRPTAVAGALVVLLLVAGGIQGTFAAFTDPAAVDAGTSPSTGFTSGAVATPVVPTAAVSSSSVRIDWSVTAAGIGTAARYEILRYPVATGGVGTVVCSTTAPTVTCLDGDPADGAAWYAVRARVGDAWTKEGGRVLHNPDTTGPTVVITTPLNGCSGTRVACGTASDPSGVASVEYSFKRRESYGIFGSVYQCWNGSGWAGNVAAGTMCPYLAATGTTTWTVPGAKANAYTGGWLAAVSFVLTVRVTDTLGLATTTDQSFSL